MATRAGFGEDALAACQRDRVRVEIFAAPRRVGELVRLARGNDEGGYRRRARFGRAPVRGILLGGRNEDRGDRLEPEERIEMSRPIFTVEPNVDVDAVQRAEHADGIRAVLEHARRPRSLRWVERARKLLVLALV